MAIVKQPRSHPLRRRPPSVWSRSRLLGSLLVLTLVLAALLAYEAHDAVRSHRITAEHALRDYASFAAWEFLVDARESLRSTLTEAMSPVTGTVRAVSPYGPLPPPTLLVASAGEVMRCEDPAADSARFYFRLDFRDGSFATSGAAPSPAMRRWVADTVIAHARTAYAPGARYATLFAEVDGERRALVYGVRYAQFNAPVAAYGFTTCASAFGAPFFRQVMARSSLLPSSVTGGLANDSLLSITVRDAAGRVLYRSAPQDESPFTGEVTLETFGKLTARAALRPAAARTLVVGQLPRSRVPLLLGLLALTAALVIIAIQQLHREHELSRMRADFISSVSHELRTPLSEILLFAETLSLDRVRSPEERREAARVIVEEARRLMHLVENVLHVSRAERQMTRLTPEPERIAPVVREVIQSFTSLMRARDVCIRAELDEQLIAPIDRGALRQMLINLLDNAVKYGPDGQTVAVGLAPAGDRARLWVDDEGTGIEPGARERIWEPFVRLERDGAPAAGSGIGLAVVRELATRHGGRAWTDDAPSGGARFIVELPGAWSAAERAPDEPHATQDAHLPPERTTREPTT